MIATLNPSTPSDHVKALRELIGDGSDRSRMSGLLQFELPLFQTVLAINNVFDAAFLREAVVSFVNSQQSQ